MIDTQLMIGFFTKLSKHSWYTYQFYINSWYSKHIRLKIHHIERLICIIRERWLKPRPQAL